MMQPSLLESTTVGTPISFGLNTRSQETKKLLQSTSAMQLVGGVFMMDIVVFSLVFSLILIRWVSPGSRRIRSR